MARTVPEEVTLHVVLDADAALKVFEAGKNALAALETVRQAMLELGIAEQQLVDSLENLSAESLNVVSEDDGDLTTGIHRESSNLHQEINGNPVTDQSPDVG